MKIDLNKINELIKQGYINKNDHPTLPISIYNYTPKAQYDQYWCEETLMCRGLVLDADGNIIARPFKKFFNYEEVLNEIPNEEFECFEKMDGSLGIIFKYNCEIIVSTRGSFISDQAIKAKEILNKYPEFISLVMNNEPAATYLVEILYPDNRIVINYGTDEKLVLLAIIYNETGLEFPYAFWSNTDFLDIPIVTKYDGLKDFNKIKELNLENKEGFVILFKNGFRMKLKFADYVELHRKLTRVSSKTIWEYLMNNDMAGLEKLIECVPDEFYEFVRIKSGALLDLYIDVEFNAHLYLNNILIEINTLKQSLINQGLDDITISTVIKKRFAEKVFSDVPKKYQGLCFALYSNKDISKGIWKMIEPKYELPFKKLSNITTSDNDL